MLFKTNTKFRISQIRLLITENKLSHAYYAFMPTFSSTYTNTINIWRVKLFKTTFFLMFRKAFPVIREINDSLVSSGKRTTFMMQ